VKDGDAVRINTPGESAHGLIGNIVRFGENGAVFVWLAEYQTEWKYREDELVAVVPQL